MEIKKLLESHRNLKVKMETTLSEIKEMRSLTERVVDYSEAGSRLCVVNRAMEIDKKLTAQYDEYIALHDRICEMIDSLDDETELIALKCVYILHYSNERAAAEMGYSVRHVSRLLKSGLDNLHKKYNTEEGQV